MAAVSRAANMGAGECYALLRAHPRSFDSLWWAFVRPRRAKDGCDIDAILAGDAG